MLPSAQLPPTATSHPPPPGWLWKVGTFLCAAVALVSYRYLIPSVPTDEAISSNAFFSPWMILHVVGAATALLIGPLQFLKRLRHARPSLHRLLGRLYVLGCTVGGVSGLALAAGAASGPLSRAGFGLLAVAWLATTLTAWRAAVVRRFVAHRAWMIRSFALTFAAVTLRVYLPIVGVLPIDFTDGYRAVSFLCWVPNLLVAEWYLRRRPAPA